MQHTTAQFNCKTVLIYNIQELFTESKFSTHPKDGRQCIAKDG